MEYNRFQEILLEEAEKIPDKFFEGLNGGVIISEEVKISPYAQGGDMLIAGQYFYSGITGSQIVLYYGSMNRLYPNLGEDQMRQRIADVLRHELRHHLERRAGTHELEDWDRRELSRMLRERQEREARLHKDAGGGAETD